MNTASGCRTIDASLWTKCTEFFERILTDHLFVNSEMRSSFD